MIANVTVIVFVIVVNVIGILMIIVYIDIV